MVNVERQECSQCGVPFIVGEADRILLRRCSPVINGRTYLIPPPQQCPACRRRRRMAWRKERHLFYRKCDACGKNMVSMYAPEASYTVYCRGCYWSDSWSALDYGQEIDFSKPLMGQFATLLKRVPLVALINVNTENSEFCNRIFDGRNNYMSIIALYAPENLIHTYYTQSCRSSIDIGLCQKTELGYELVDAENCYNCRYSNRIRNCSDSYFLQDCISCSNCFGCKNLHQKSYHIFNRACSKDEYLQFIKEAKLSQWSSVMRYQGEAKQFFLTLPSQSVIVQSSENVQGTNIYHSKNCGDVFDIYHCEEMHHSGYGERSHHSLDCYGFGETAHSYELVSSQHSHACLFSATAIDSADLLYCYETYANTRNCFACCSIKKGQYCILNKQHSESEYHALASRLIEQMQATGEWGEGFPAELSPFAYNESDAQMEFPLTANTAKEQGLRWLADLDRLPNVSNARQAADLPDAIEDVDDSIVNEVILSARSGRPYRVVTQELAFYRQNGIPLPRLHPEERHADRMLDRNSRANWQRRCAKCQRIVLSAYAPERMEVIYCPDCYRATVF